MACKLILLRHGESEWNLENRFTGWVDVDITEKGEEEAKKAGNLLLKNNFKIDYYFTNVIARSSKTMAECRNLKLVSLKTGTDG